MESRPSTCCGAVDVYRHSLSRVAGAGQHSHTHTHIYIYIQKKVPPSDLFAHYTITEERAVGSPRENACYSSCDACDYNRMYIYIEDASGAS